MAKHAYAPSTDGSRRIDLDELDAGDTGRVDKEAGLGELEVWGNELAELGNLLTYAGKHALLVVLQGRDASGKDGAIRKILEFTNIQNAAVAPFKVPTAEEYAHDFLWRAHRVVPARGHVALFNRSYYEDVIAARVHNIVPEATWKRRYAHINAFEQLLVDSDVIVLKFYLHVSRDEEIERLYAREKDPRTAWKLNPNDWRELPLWNEVTAAYEDALEKCATPAAPWYLVPADKKWFRNLAVVQRIVLALRPYKSQWLDALKEMGKEALKDIRALRARADLDGNGKRKKRRR
ncbi:MAG TPA: PPK2 family polyphosphate kinase [Polyangia bacterium]|jgi:PPK2 family polyphosphate:nucleotide phosphotransferase|nr:PPK2 family polyphosphate kinase [Polyangia bacterium]